ncbi:MAG: hypothetical protein M3081_14785 [Gemmatimonadota bacterium]|nr:hypothetical protein [Gemmatimonadota bacterium]
MPLSTKVAAAYNYSLVPREPVPIIRGWNRLEGRPRNADFERSLRAEVRDPLWFLTRQWQYGEFEGEDAGSPIDARVAYTTAPLDRFVVGASNEAYDPTTPLEVTVAREAIAFDLTLHMQASRVFERILRDALVPNRFKDYVARFPLVYATAVSGADTSDAAALFETGKAFLFDASAVIGAVRDGSHAGIVAGFPLIGGPEIATLEKAGTELVDWFERTYGAPRTAPSTWRADRLGYSFACSATNIGMDFVADEFRGGSLDWYAFDGARAEQPGAAVPVALSFLPTAIEFAGMPSPRYWEIENSRTEFGHLDVHTNDLAKLVLAEFMLIYSNDWCLLPLELEVGSFTRVEGILVTDVFGDQTIVRAADRGRDEDWRRWSMFRMTGDDIAEPGLLLAPALTAAVTAPVMEQVQFLRDEMANMVWAVEQRVMSRLGEAFDPSVGAPVPAEPPPTAAPTRYLLGTEAPFNWRPFIPVHLPGSLRSIRLQRGRLPDQPLQTAGTILRVPGPYFIAEEEVPRAGRLVDRSFKRARWIDGSTFLWVGRRSSTGRGEGSSGLVFDHIVETRPHVK